MKARILSVLAVLTLGSLASVSSFAYEGYVGAQLGAAEFTSGPSDFVYGLDAEYHLVPNFALGLYLTHEGQSTDEVLGVSASRHLTVVAAKGTYFLNNDGYGFNFGLILGLGINAASVVGASNTSTNLAIGPSVSYNFPIAAGWTVAPVVNFITVTSSGGDENIFNFMGNITYWF